MNNPELVAGISRENIFALEGTIADFLDYLLVQCSDSELSYHNMLVLRTLCVLTWREAFTQPTAKILADVIARLLVEKLSVRTLRGLLTHLAASATDVALIIATVLRLTSHTLQLEPELWDTDGNVDTVEYRGSVAASKAVLVEGKPSISLAGSVSAVAQGLKF
ncbi:unnamed protein product [Dibothriocephalus latus]|uniref:Uncharacterized protein n=1 Tax=Dibothriocephalus latus TaxID=60516 RepID=A0A3P7RGF4_DIBLA|nr:unnamed protein product [Dibothriocephalus latus]